MLLESNVLIKGDCPSVCADVFPSWNMCSKLQVEILPVHVLLIKPQAEVSRLKQAT